MYDPRRLIHTQLTLSDFVRSATRASISAFGQPEVKLTLTHAGEAALCLLTRGLARRGAQLHHQQQQATAFDGRVISRPYVDYRRYPHGICGASHQTILTSNARTARRIAQALRG